MSTLSFIKKRVKKLHKKLKHIRLLLFTDVSGKPERKSGKENEEMERTKKTEKKSEKMRKRRGEGIYTYTK